MEKRKELLESLKIGAEDLLSTAVPFEAEAQMTTIDIQTAPEWSLANRGEKRMGHTRSHPELAR